MRTQVIVIVGMVFLAGALNSDAIQESVTDRVDRLIKQLGHEQFKKREEASKQLEAIGEPALDALRKAASADDAEIRLRAERLVQAITRPIRAAAAKKELEKLKG